MTQQLLAAYRGFFVYLSLAFAALLVLVPYELIARNFNIGSVSWVEDVGQLILLWVGLLSVPLVQLQGTHIGANLFRPRWAGARLTVALLRCLVFLIIGIAWVWLGTMNVINESGMVTEGGLQLPLACYNIVLPLAGVLMAITAIAQGSRLLRPGA